MAQPTPITPTIYTTASVLSKNKELQSVNQTITAMKVSLGDLGRLFDSLGQQSAQVVQGGHESQVAQYLGQVRKDMDESDRKQEKQIAEVHAILDNALKFEIIEHLRSYIEAGVLNQIDELVKTEVESELSRLRPKSLQDEVKKHQRELEEVEKKLHNSESRRANALLRTSKITAELHTIYRPDGVVSPLYPKTLQELFALDDKSAKKLLKEYQVSGATDNRETNVNRFMQFCGVVYQLIKTADGDVPYKVTICELFD